MKFLITFLMAILVGASVASADSSVQSLYRNCSDSAGSTMRLYAEASVVDVTDRAATLVFEGMLYMGKANGDLSSFSSADGSITARFDQDSKGAVLQTSRGQKAFGKCVPTDIGD